MVDGGLFCELVYDLLLTLMVMCGQVDVDVAGTLPLTDCASGLACVWLRLG